MLTGPHSPRTIIHYFLSSHLRYGSCFLHQQHGKNEAVSMVTGRATRGRCMVGSLSQAPTLIGQQRERERNNNLSGLMNIHHNGGGGAFNSACLLFFVQYLIWETLYWRGMHYACLQWFKEVMTSTRQVTSELSHQRPVEPYLKKPVNHATPIKQSTFFGN